MSSPECVSSQVVPGAEARPHNLHEAATNHFKPFGHRLFPEYDPPGRAGRSSSSLLLPILELGDSQVYEPETRALLGTASQVVPGAAARRLRPLHSRRPRCVCERERKRGRERSCVCVCVSERVCVCLRPHQFRRPRCLRTT